MKFGIGGFYENLSAENTGNWLQSDRNVGTLREDLRAFIVPVDFKSAMKGLLVANMWWRVENVYVLGLVSPRRHKNVRGRI
jgi:hypothetical protein